MAGLAEAVVGAAKDAYSAFYITISTGVGGGLILDKKIINGAHSQTAEIYNMIINNDEKAITVINKSINNISIGIANIIAVVETEVVVIGGAVTINNSYLIPKIIEGVKNKVADLI